MNTKEIRLLNNSEILSRLKDVSEEITKIKFQHSFRPLGNTARISYLKRYIARLETVLREKN